MAAGEPKITLVTGSSRGIGKAIALRLADTASGVIVHYGKDRTSARDVVRKIREKGIRSGCYKADLRRKAEAHSLVQRVEKAFGRLDILVNNFGPLQVNPWEDLDTGDWEDALRANLLSAFACTQAALPGMRRRRWGRIINIGYSRAEDLGPFQDILPYAVAKTGLLIMTRSVAASVARDGVTVNMVSPGLIAGGVLPENTEIPTGHLGRPEDVAAAVAFLASEQASYITGTNLVVSGGWKL